ncbi:MAG: Bax protein [Oleiphilaceae bacterium]|jgi:Bax protein
MLSFKKVLIILIPLFVIGLTYFFFSSKEKETEKKTEKKPLPEMTVQEKKARFISIILPVAKEVYSELVTRYQEVSSALKAGETFDDLKEEYGASSDEELLMALKPHPISITLAQAAMESSWATSRFFREANNIFGVWSFDENDDRIAAGEKRGNKTIWLKKYSSVEAAISDYYRTLARGKAFVAFRRLNLTTSDPYKLVKKLNKYSEKGALYGEELTSIIKFNKFYEHDL